MVPSTYATIEVVGFMPPLNPSTALKISTNAWAALITDLKRDMYDYKLYVLFNAALIQQLLGAVVGIHYRGLRNKYTGYAGNNTQEILAHLDAIYGDITEGKMEENEKIMKMEYDSEMEMDMAMLTRSKTPLIL